MTMRRTWRPLLAVLATAVILTAGAASAYADPLEPVMHFQALRAALASSPDHHLQGYMETVVDASQEPTRIPLTVLAVPPTGTADDDLIMFDAYGPLMDKFTAIVAGMSGSPVYVDDGTGADKLIGAVSYGDEFTLGGTGLATPIDAMSEIENGYASAAPLSAPVITSNGVVNRIIVARDPQNYAGAAAEGAFVARPLSTVFIGGLSPKSKGYQALAGHLASKGVSVVSLSRPLAGGDSADGGGFTTTLTAGASVAALSARGDLWVGDIGTVTYANGQNVLAFGHPAFWAGNTALYMANAYIEGVWPGTAIPYKVGDPGAIRGTITQDRLNGVLGKSDLRVAETTITSRAVNSDTGRVATATVYIPRALIANGSSSLMWPGMGDGFLVSAAVYEAGSKLFDMKAEPGSAHTTTTVTVLDGTTTRTVTMVNYSSESSDIAYTVSQAAATAITTLQSVIPYGIEKPRILSVDLDGSYSAHRTDAEIVAVDAPHGIHIGANPVHISVLQYGTLATQTVDTTLTLPAGTPLGGTLSANSAYDVADNSMTGGGYDSVYTRATIKGLVDQLNQTVPDPTIVVRYKPGSASAAVDPWGDEVDTPATLMSTITKQILAPWPVAGGVQSPVTTIQAQIVPNPVSYGGFVGGLVGEVDGPSSAQTVSLYARTAGSPSETLVATTTATPNEGVLTFQFPLMHSYTTNTAFRIHADESDSSTGDDQTVWLNVRAMLTLKSSASSVRLGSTVTLSASVFPANSAGGSVVFERASGKKWVKIAEKTLGASGSKATASVKWKPGRGSFKVRARYLGGTFNAATTSGTALIKVI